VGLPLLWFLLRRQNRRNDLSSALAHYALWLWVVLFFSRAFNDNYLGFIIAVLALALCIGEGTALAGAEARDRSAGEPRIEGRK
jgi:hypothetical protein